MMTRSSVCLGTLLLTLQGVGCGSSEGDPAPIPKEEFAHRYSEAYCQSFGSCCRAIGSSVDEQSCASTFESKLGGDTLLGSSRVRYDAAAAGRCLDALSSVLSDCSISASENSLGSEACRAVFVPLQNLGDPCTSSRECVRVGNVQPKCLSANGAGTCALDEFQSAPHGKQGDACNIGCDDRALDVECAGGAIVTTSTTDVACVASEGLDCIAGSCQPLPGLNEPCELACQAGLYCDQSAAIGICLKKLADGGACTSGEVCLEGACQNGVCGPSKVDAATCDRIF